MNKKDLTNDSAAPVTADMNFRLAALRKDVILSEVRAIRLGCAKTNGTYIAKLKRKAEGERFTVFEITEEQPPKPQGGAFRNARALPAPEPQCFDWTEFHYDACCPGCGDRNGRTNCDGCGRLVCDGNSWQAFGPRQKFFCHPACGASFHTTPASSIAAESCSHPALPSPQKHKALEAPCPRLTGPRK